MKNDNQKPIDSAAPTGEAVGCSVLLAELNLSASELLHSAFLYHLNCNPISTKPFIESLCNASDWIEEQQKQAIKDIIKSAISSNHLTDEQYVLWECAYANLS